MSAPAAAAPPAAGGEGGGPPPPPPNLTSNRRLQQTQAQVDEVVDIMRVNVDKVLERDQKLSELDDRADALQAGASQFETSAAKLKRKYWWKNLKMMIILGVICTIILIVIIGEFLLLLVKAIFSGWDGLSVFTVGWARSGSRPPSLADRVAQPQGKKMFWSLKKKALLLPF
nr:vesicle-associated membrane protein 2 isoform X2 [Zootoca vivipara]